jgi:hypothetical protein
MKISDSLAHGVHELGGHVVIITRGGDVIIVDHEEAEYLSYKLRQVMHTRRVKQQGSNDA